MKRSITIAAAVAALAVPATASAAGVNDPGYGTPGSTQAGEVGAQCGTGAGSGAFGAFGAFGDVTHDFGVNNPGSDGAPGANGYQTGLNNSAVCGNRQS
jgi:hypothetical protein